MPQELLVSDESYNTYNTRVLTAGGDLSRFLKNPIMLFNHTRAAGKKDDILPIGTWQLRVDGDKIFATPQFDMEDSFAASIAGKFERKIIRSASIGLRILDMQADAPDEFGNARYTITKWQLLEISLVDVPSNGNAVMLYDADDNLVELGAAIELYIESSSNKIASTMKFQNIPTLLGLAAEASEQAVTDKINTLLQAQAEAATLRAEVQRLKDEAETRRSAEYSALLDQAVAAKKIKPAQREQFLSLMKADYDNAKAILEAMTPQMNLSDVPAGAKTDAPPSGPQKYEGKTFSELHRTDGAKLAWLKQNDYETFSQLYESEYGKPYRQTAR
jgi:hypothetical protein